MKHEKTGKKLVLRKTFMYVCSYSCVYVCVCERELSVSVNIGCMYYCVSKLIIHKVFGLFISYRKEPIDNSFLEQVSVRNDANVGQKWAQKENEERSADAWLTSKVI